MKKTFFSIFCFLFVFTLTFFNISSAKAGIYFITKTENVVSQNDDKPCQILGYTVTAKSCEAKGLTLSNKCPKDSNYGKECSCGAGYDFDKSNCTNNRTLSGKSCGEKYQYCECDTKAYPYPNGSGCASPKKIDYSVSCLNTNNVPSYKSCSCPSEYSQTCSGNLEGVGTACDGKYTSCKCKATFKKCNYGKGSGADTCVDAEGTKYTNCNQPTCADGGYVATTPSGQTCTSVSYNDLTCYKDCKVKTCADGGYVATIPSGQTCTSMNYEGLTCYKDCKASCAATVSCSYGCKTTCGGKCVECYPACTGLYEYNFSESDCYVRPYRMMWQPSNPNCGRCECDNSNSNCGGRACACMYI